MTQTDTFLKIMQRTASGAELRVVLYILCHTWGKFDDSRLTLDELLNGRKGRDGARLDAGTGLSKPTILAALRTAKQHNLITIEIDSSRGGGRVRKRYGMRY